MSLLIWFIYQKMENKNKKYLQLNYSHIPVRAEIYHKGEAIKKWSVENPLGLVNSVIDNMDMNGFDKMKMKNTIELVTDIFKPKTIKIIEKEKYE